MLMNTFPLLITPESTCSPVKRAYTDTGESRRERRRIRRSRSGFARGASACDRRAGSSDQGTSRRGEVGSDQEGVGGTVADPIEVPAFPIVEQGVPIEVPAEEVPQVPTRKV